MPTESRQRIVHQQRLEKLLPQLPDYVQEFIQSKKRSGYSSSTLLGYAHEYMKFFKWLQSEGFAGNEHIKDVPYSLLETLRKQNVEFYIEYLQEEDIRTEKEIEKNLPIKKRSQEAVNRNINAIKSLFNYLTQETENDDGECYFYRNVFSKIKLRKDKETSSNRSERISSSIFENHEIDEFISYLKTDYEKSLEGRGLTDFRKNKERDIAIISILLGSGARVSEIAGLTLADIMFQKEKISIIRKGNKADTVRVLPSSLEDLKEYLRVRKDRYHASEDDAYVFLTKYGGQLRPISVRTIQNFVMRYTKAFNSHEFGSGKGMSPHKFRHTFATEWILNGGDIVVLRNQLGHNSIETTSQYTNISSEASKSVMKKMESSRKQ